MWSGFDRFSISVKTEVSSQNEPLGDPGAIEDGDGDHGEHISTIAGSLASIVTGHSESAVCILFVLFYLIIISIFFLR